jgi:pyruvate kinase
MKPLIHRTKIVATIDPASGSPDRIGKMLLAGMNMARLNFSHGKYDDHAERIQQLRDAAEESEAEIVKVELGTGMPIAYDIDAQGQVTDKVILIRRLS